MVAGNGFSQLFITDCDTARLRTLVSGITDEHAYFEAEAGTFKRIG